MSLFDRLFRKGGGDDGPAYIRCDALPADVLVLADESGDGIPDGSVLAVRAGQCLLIVEGGVVVDVRAEPGEYDFHSGSGAACEQRAYFVNTKELPDNRFGTAAPAAFRLLDPALGLDRSGSLRCSGTFSFRIADPVRFYERVCGNVGAAYRRESIAGQLRDELLAALPRALKTLTDAGMPWHELSGRGAELTAALNEALAAAWREGRGVELVSIAVTGVKLAEEDEAAIRTLRSAPKRRKQKAAGKEARDE